MAQKRFTTFKAAVESFPLGEMHIGLLKPGRFNGFTLMTPNSGLSVNIEHEEIIRKTDKAGTEDNKFGAIVMPSGIIIHENTAITLDLFTNTSNGTDRRDILICEHNYQEIQAGTVATYSIIQGPNDDDTRPVLTDPTKQIIIGEFLFKANSGNFADIVYTPEIAPLPGDMDAADIYSYIEQLVIQEIQDAGSSAENVGDGPGIIFRDTEGGIINLRTLKSPDNSVKVVVNGDIIEITRGTPNDIVEVSSALTLSAEEHNGKTLRVTGSGYNITIPTGLPVGFEVFGYMASSAVPSASGLYPNVGAAPSNILIVPASGVKGRANGTMLVLGKSFYIQGTALANYYDILGDLV